MPPEVWRLFIGCFIPPELLLEAYHRLKAVCSPWVQAKWVRPEQLHFTLAFLGEVPRSRLSELFQLIAPLLCEHDSPLVLRGIGVFPRWQSPRVLYIGVENSNGVLQEVRATLYTVLATAGFLPAEEQHPFVPHVTVARLKQVRHPERLQQELRPYREREFAFVPSFRPVLVRSVLTSEGPIYSVLSPEPEAL